MQSSVWVILNWRRPVLFGAVALISVVGAAGCSGDRDSLKKRVSALQEEVTLLQNGQDRLEERMAAMELNQSRAAQRPVQTEPATPGTMERPRLKVIRVEPDSADVPPAQGTPTLPSPLPEGESSDSNRPVIRGTGTQLESHMPPGSTSSLERLPSGLPRREAAAPQATSSGEPRRLLGA